MIREAIEAYESQKMKYLEEPEIDIYCDIMVRVINRAPKMAYGDLLRLQSIVERANSVLIARRATIEQSEVA